LYWDCFLFKTDAQEKISIEKAIETAISNNIKIKNAKLNSEYCNR
jgi:cobalt-zinc-cadmium resistance protein CzcA